MPQDGKILPAAIWTLISFAANQDTHEGSSASSYHGGFAPRTFLLVAAFKKRRYYMHDAAQDLHVLRGHFRITEMASYIGEYEGEVSPHVVMSSKYSHDESHPFR